MFNPRELDSMIWYDEYQQNPRRLESLRLHLQMTLHGLRLLIINEEVLLKVLDSMANNVFATNETQ